jgi:hypothetical protein
MMTIMMPNEVRAEQDKATAWSKVEDVYRQSVEAILAYGTDPRVKDWLDTATTQFLRRAGTMQKTALAQALVAKIRKDTSVVSIRKQEDRPPMDAYQSFCTKVEAEIATAKKAGKTLPWHEADSLVNKRFLGSYQRAQEDQSVLKLAAPPETPVMKMDTATTALDMIVKANIAKGMPYAQAYEEACRQHPSLYLESHGGEPWKIA